VALAFISGIGGGELLIIMVIFLLLFGSKKLPGIARNLGKAMAELQRAAREVREEFLNADRELSMPPTTTPPAPSSTSDAGAGETGEWHPDMEAYGYEPPAEAGGPSAERPADAAAAPVEASPAAGTAVSAPPESAIQVAEHEATAAGSESAVEQPASLESDGETRSV